MACGARPPVQGASCQDLPVSVPRCLGFIVDPGCCAMKVVVPAITRRSPTYHQPMAFVCLAAGLLVDHFQDRSWAVSTHPCSITCHAGWRFCLQAGAARGGSRGACTGKEAYTEVSSACDNTKHALDSALVSPSTSVVMVCVQADRPVHPAQQPWSRGSSQRQSGAECHSCCCVVMACSVRK